MSFYPPLPAAPSTPAPGAWANLTLINGFLSAAPLGGHVPQSRLVGDVVELRGTVAVPDAGVTAPAAFTVLPAGQRPSGGRPLLTANVDDFSDGATGCTPNAITVDDGSGGFAAGTMIVSFDVAAAGVGTTHVFGLDGLSFPL